MKTIVRLAAGVWAVLAVLSAAAAAPQITRISAPTLQSGGVTQLIIEGKDLGANPRIVLPVPIAAQKVLDKATATKVKLEVKLDAVPPGIYPLRLASDLGISNAVTVHVDSLAARPFAAQVGPLPACLQGNLAGSATLTTSFAGKKGQRVVIEVEARRAGSLIDPVLRVLDPNRLQIAGARGSNPLSGDARVTLALPADGAYTIELHDAQFRAGTPNHFRLRVGEFAYADLPFPLASQRGTRATFQLIGNLPETAKVEADLTDAPGQSWVRLPAVPGLAGNPPSVLVSDIPEITETPTAKGQIQEVKIPVGVSGRLLSAGEEDRYRLAVQPGMKLKLEVLAERAGSPIDAILILRNEAGAQLARSDDQADTFDPSLEYTVPKGVNALVAVVADQARRGGPDHVYRLSVTPADQPDFSLALLDDSLEVPQGGAALLSVRVSRTGYNGPIKLALPGLPAGLEVSGAEIPASTSNALISLTAAGDAPPGQVVTRVIGESAEPGVALRRLALPPETTLTRAQPNLRGELAVALTGPAPLAVRWESADDTLPIGGKASGKVVVRPPADVKGPIRLTLLTSQVVPQGKGKKEDVNRALRFETAPKLAADQTAEFKILVPADLPPRPYDIAIRADLMGPDNKTVKLSAVTPARRLPAAK